MSLKKLISTLLLAYIGLIFIIEIAPEISTAVASSNSTGFTLVMMNLAAWLLPVGGLIGIFYGVFKLFGGGGRGGG